MIFESSDSLQSMLFQILSPIRGVLNITNHLSFKRQAGAETNPAFDASLIAATGTSCLWNASH